MIFLEDVDNDESLFCRMDHNTAICSYKKYQNNPFKCIISLQTHFHVY